MSDMSKDIGKIEPVKMPAAAPAPGAAAPSASVPPTPGAAAPGRSARSLFEPAMLGSRGLLPEDLPYAAEVEAALARRPERGARWLSVGVFLFFAAFTAWASVATLDEVTRAEGQVIASSRTQVIQNLEGGILQSVDVNEGQIVEKNAVLARLDNAMAESSLRDMLYKAMENLTSIRRLRAIIQTDPLAFSEEGAAPLAAPEGDAGPAKGEPAGAAPSAAGLSWPGDMRAWLELGTGSVLTEEQLEQGRRLAEVQAETFLVQMRQRASELRVLSEQSTQREQEVKEQQARRSQLRESLGLIRQQMNIAESLLARKSYSRVQYLELRERLVSTQGELDALAVSIPRAEAAASEARHRMRLRRAELDAVLMEEINRRSLELASLRESLSASSDRVTRTELRSPVRGTVKKIYITTVGGVVKPGENIMEIVPLDDTLLVEARVRPQDVAFLHPGQKSMVKISAYDFSIYGGLNGVLEQISADTIEDKRGDFYYLVKVRTPETAIRHEGEVLPIMPGMVATVDILTGKKTVLDYLLKPILKAKQNALREK
ncbi:HlyD family type I secretion periplasmic adaptor subunit [Mailhella sp.]